VRQVNQRHLALFFSFFLSFFVIEMECHGGRTDDRLQLQTLLKCVRACVCLFVLCVVCARVCMHAKLSVARALHLIRNTWRSNTWAAAVLILPRGPRPQPLKNTTPPHEEGVQRSQSSRVQLGSKKKGAEKGDRIASVRWTYVFVQSSAAVHTLHCYNKVAR
jgi:hypothetical protein